MASSEPDPPVAGLYDATLDGPDASSAPSSPPAGYLADRRIESPIPVLPTAAGRGAGSVRLGRSTRAALLVAVFVSAALVSALLVGLLAWWVLDQLR